MIQDKITLKNYFLTGQQPTESNYGDLIDTLVNLFNTNQIMTFDSGNVAINKSTDDGYTFSIEGTLAVSGNAAFSNVSISDTANMISGNIGHLGGFTNTPQISLGASAGTSATSTIDGTDLAGTISLTTGTACIGSDMVFKVAFDVAYDIIPKVLLTPSNASSASLYGDANVWVTGVNVNGFDVNVGSTALTDEIVYEFNYFCIA